MGLVDAPKCNQNTHIPVPLVSRSWKVNGNAACGQGQVVVGRWFVLWHGLHQLKRSCLACGREVFLQRTREASGTHRDLAVPLWGA